MRSSFPLLLLAMAGCYDGPYTAPYGASISFAVHTLTVVSTGNDSCDNSGVVYMNDVLVVDSTGELPLENVIVEVEAPSTGGAYVLPQEAVMTVDFPTTDDDITSDADVREACTDDEGNFDNTEEWCAWYYDEDNDTFYQFGSNYADAGGYAPTYFIGQTDNRGLMRIYHFIDCVGSEIDIEANIGTAQDTFTISAEDPDSG